MFLALYILVKLLIIKNTGGTIMKKLVHLTKECFINVVFGIVQILINGGWLVFTLIIAVMFLLSSSLQFSSTLNTVMIVVNIISLILGVVIFLTLFIVDIISDTRNIIIDIRKKEFSNKKELIRSIIKQIWWTPVLMFVVGFISNVIILIGWFGLI